jgi:hypothetical protein
MWNWLTQITGFLASIIGIFAFLWGLTRWMGLVPRNRAGWYLLWFMSYLVLAFVFAEKQRNDVPAQHPDLSSYTA